jgi:hypothetical protein
MTYANNDVYDGNWTFGKRNGDGKMQSESGLYEGQWVNDFRHGYGTHGILIL